MFSFLVFLLVVHGIDGKTWTACANQHDDCKLINQNVTTIRYGIQNRFYYLEVSGVAAVSCKDWMGDPYKGEYKKCWYEPEYTGHALNYDYVFCGLSGQTCALGNHTRYVKWGSNGAYFYSLHYGSVVCSTSWLGNPGGGGTLECFISEPMTLPPFEPCATEHNRCEDDDYPLSLFRFGHCSFTDAFHF